MSSRGKPSLRVYFVTHRDGRFSGVLMRRRESLFENPPPRAYGRSVDDVLAQLAVSLQVSIAVEDDTIERYLWQESFHTRTIDVEVYPATMVKKQPVIGARSVPLRVSFCWSRLAYGAYRVVLPRFGWWMILEDLEIASEAIEHEIASAMLGTDPHWIYDFRHEGEEFVKEWSPDWSASGSSDVSAENNERLERFPVMSAIADDLVERAARRRLPPVLGDDVLFHRMLPELLRPERTSVLLVGGPGVGKTTFVYRFARAIQRQAKGKGRNDHLPGIWSANADRILGGMVYLGMWQERVLRMIEELRSEGDYLYVDRITGLIEKRAGAGAISDLLGPAVTSGQVHVIAECTDTELSQARRLAPELLDHFTVVRVQEPKAAEALNLLTAYQERRGGPQIEPAGMKRLLRHVSAYQRDQMLPGKGIRFIDWLNHEPRRPKTLNAFAVSEAFARYTGMPVELIADERAVTVASIAERLKEGVVGQDAACTAAARVLVPLKAGLNDPERPVGGLFFAGPTGVGKTELARQISRYMFGSSDRMIRIDMSEYGTQGSAGRLLQVGRGIHSLAERVRRQPLSLVLLDEIEKAHPEVFDLLLGVLGEGRLTDTLGRAVDFRMSVIVMTSNLGVEERPATGFMETDSSDFLRAVRDHFRPEFVGRIDQIVSFQRLSPTDIAKIVDLSVAEASRRVGLRRRGLSIRVEPSAKKRLAELGYDPLRGARPLKRVIEERVITPIAVILASNTQISNQTIRVVAGYHPPGPAASGGLVVGTELSPKRSASEPKPDPELSG
ncbi:MAG: AAA family ATPase [Myxococcota bacterium]